MLESINNYSYKSFKNYTGPLDSEKFKRVNIIFGYNGKGKTALSRGIIKEFSNNNDKENFRFYDKDYIKNNLLLENDNRLMGIIATFGEKNVDVEKEINQKEKIIEDTTIVENDIDKIDEEINTEIDKIFNFKKGKSSIKKKSANNIEELMNAYKKDLDPALKLVESEDELKQIKDSSEYEKELLNIQNSSIVDILTLDSKEINEILKIMQNEYNNNEIPSTQIIEWLKEGVIIHKQDNATHCKFCGNNLNIEKIEEKVDKYLNDKKQQDLKKLDFFSKKVSTMFDSKKNINDNKILFSNIIGENVDVYYDNLSKNVSDLESFIDVLKQKQDNMSSKYKFEEDKLFNIMKNINDSIDNIKKEMVEKITSLQAKIDKSNILIKGAISFDISNSSLISSLLKKRKENLEKLKEYNDSNSKILNEINKLKNSKATTSDFANYLNDLLLQLNIDFYLDIIDNNYIIKNRINNMPILLDDISEGENNLLALLFFYYELFDDDKQKLFKNHISLIVVDDPISSVDDVNKMYILELIKKILELNSPQIFMFTHVWEDFCNICYGKVDCDKPGKETSYRFYEIKKNDKGSYLIKTKTNETPYKHDFKEIYEFSLKENADNLNDCEIYHYPNIMRKILEEYMRFKVSDSSPTINNISNVKIALCKSVNEASNNDNIQIPVLLDVCNILSHKSSRNPEQILKSAIYLMRKIKEVDINHFSTMTN